MAGGRVKFLPSERAVPVREGESLLDAAMRAGVHINASCGGNGTCGKCRVRVAEGETEAPVHPSAALPDFDKGVRLACMTIPRGDVVVEVPLESQIDRSILKRQGLRPAVLSPAGVEALIARWGAAPLVVKDSLEIPPPTPEDNISDLERLLRELRAGKEIRPASIGYGVLRKLSRALREEDWTVTVTHLCSGAERHLVNIEPGRREQELYGLVIDVGTTTVCGELLHLGEDAPGVLAEYSDYNGQISFGDDVISRILHAQKKGGLERLQEVVINTINGVIRELLGSSGLAREAITMVVLAGNTTMTHLVLGLEPKYIMLAPYTPGVTVLPLFKAGDVGLDLEGHVPLHVVPCVSSYVGGDIVAGVLGSGMARSDDLSLFLDMGTNGEIVLGNKDWLMCASCSAGPAFEGGGIRFGMRAGKGAIEQVRINPVTFEPMVLTVGHARPMGICGSGLIALAAGLFETGLVDQKGKFVRPPKTDRVRPGEDGYEYVVCRGAETHTGTDVVITEIDLDNLLRTKAAMYAGCKVLLEGAGYSFSDLDRIIISGGFGHSIDLEKAQTIGLFPELPVGKFLFLGNGSLLGGRLIASSKAFVEEAEVTGRRMTTIELSNSGTFMDEFMAALFLPHTDGRAFPEVMERVRPGDRTGPTAGGI